MAPDDSGDPAPHDEPTLPPSERVEELESEVSQLEATIDELEEEVEDLAAQLDQRTDTLARVQADYENLKKRSDREKQEARRAAEAELVEVLADVLDDVDRALGADPDDNVRKGLELLTRKVEDKLDEIGAQRISPDPGTRFDPQLHEALITVDSDEHEPESVIEVLQPGYELDGRVVRAARVKVARAAGG